MAFTLYSLIQAAILFVNAIAVLHEERFLSKSKCLSKNLCKMENRREDVTSSPPHGGGRLMVWGSGRFQKVNHHGSRSTLQHHVVLSGLRLVGSDFTVQEDDEPKRTFEFCTCYLDGRLE
ncbi:immediate early response 3-interacting protein 1 precursor [Silurus meridionalis]|nr:immediate early response 3-interacting protein 1 precursor [Silurus meridionalis]